MCLYVCKWHSHTHPSPEGSGPPWKGDRKIVRAWDQRGLKENRTTALTNAQGLWVTGCSHKSFMRSNQGPDIDLRWTHESLWMRRSWWLMASGRRKVSFLRVWPLVGCLPFSRWPHTHMKIWSAQTGLCGVFFKEIWIWEVVREWVREELGERWVNVIKNPLYEGVKLPQN